MINRSKLIKNKHWRCGNLRLILFHCLFCQPSLLKLCQDTQSCLLAPVLPRSLVELNYLKGGDKPPCLLCPSNQPGLPVERCQKSHVKQLCLPFHLLLCTEFRLFNLQIRIISSLPTPFPSLKLLKGQIYIYKYTRQHLWEKKTLKAMSISWNKL